MPAPQTASIQTGISASGRIARHAEILSAQLRMMRDAMFPPTAQKTLRSFSSGEVARFVGVSDGYLRQLSLDGLGPVPNLSPGGRRSYSLAQMNDLRQFLASHRPKEALTFLPRRRAHEKLQVLLAGLSRLGDRSRSPGFALRQARRPMREVVRPTYFDGTP
ncbi:hypothetical protein GCM10011390_33540 [Aureimonas endophytica]|uniref:MerR-like DNA binding protein n=1 Tax=Aureimonas endophytica TaxID=2027858 RepID=A0A916ZSD0_9HYPH|nr:hypothetical protein [Aureimonas endophytica]GGE11732.1 hypothetical protein GCM10011390_33540 [Aureimonas endophytica]